MDLNKILVKNSNIRSSNLKLILLKEGIKENRCEVCGISEWQRKPIVCQLHHIDGDNTNNTLENLQILCPNCHSQTDTYCTSRKKTEKSYCKICGKQISKHANYCNECFHIQRRVIERPTLEQLVNDYKELHSLLQIGRKYGVSSKSIQKWFRYYNYNYKEQ